MTEDVGTAVMEKFQIDDGGVIKKKLLATILSPILKILELVRMEE